MVISTFVFFACFDNPLGTHGSFSLLGVGPNAEGEIVEPMAQNLLDTGKWLQYSGQCVYNTVSFLSIDS
jgi:alpha-L-fucosidase